MSEFAPHTVVESPSFNDRALELLGEAGRDSLIEYLATNPHAGQVIPDSGGLRKLRWAVPGRGKRGGSRVIYYVHSAEYPLFLLLFFEKNRKADLSPDERRRLKVLLPVMLREYSRRIS